MLATGTDGDGLIARIGPDGLAAATAEPGVRPFAMTGWPTRGIIVAGEAIGDTGTAARTPAGGVVWSRHC